MTGVFGISRGDRTAASALSAGAETLGYALLEAHAQYATDTSTPVLVVYADEPADPGYGTIEEEVQGGAVAILLDEAPAGHLSCSRTAVADGNASPEGAGTLFATQSQAVHHCLDTHAAAQWRGEYAVWEWSWDEGVA
jgi:hypothetical protein